MFVALNIGYFSRRIKKRNEDAMQEKLSQSLGD